MKKTETLKKNYEFLRIYKKGRFFAGKYLVIYVWENQSEGNRLGITVSNKIGKSIKRNRLKRLIRESYRLYEEFIPGGLDIIFVARKVEEEAGFAEIKKEMKFLLNKMKIFDKEKWEGQKG